MNSFDIRKYQAVDTLYLWWLADPKVPRLIGELATVRAFRGVSLRYAASWLRSGFPLSEDLPLLDMEFLPVENETAAGAVDDARPDRWGEHVIRFLDQPPRLSVMEFLLFAGDDRFGALGVSVAKESYAPRWFGPLPQLSDVVSIDRLVRAIQNNEPVEAEKLRLIRPGCTLGGARPKALIVLDGHPWVLKFNEVGEPLDVPLVEHAAMTLAAKAGICVAETRPIALPRGHALAVKRFDRSAGLRKHALSAKVVLKAAGECMGYPELAQVLRRRGVIAGGQNFQHMAELFRRMVFNILIDNTDDHEKNHVLLMTDQGEYALSPAFDVLPSAQALGYQQMRVGKQQADSTLVNALSEHHLLGLTLADAKAQVRQVAKIVAGWRTHFESVGVTQRDILSLATQMDRPFLLEQRDAWTG